MSAMSTPEPQQQIGLADPVPWFGAKTVGGNSIDLHVLAGRWVVLAFLGAAGAPAAEEQLAAILALAAKASEAALMVLAITPDAQNFPRFAQTAQPGFALIEDRDSGIARAYGAVASPRTIVLDPMLRAVANIAWTDPNGHAATLAACVAGLPPVDDSAGVPMSAPVLIVPRVFEFELCDFLVGLYDEMGGTDSGFMMAEAGKTATVVNHQLKRRQDLVIGHSELRTIIRDRIVRRLLPAIERHFQYRATRMDRYMVACYDSVLGGHFYRHRDNLLPGTRHRRFAVSINLAGGYQGCDLVFPEFGSRTYRPPTGGAVVFSTATLHQVQPITGGRRVAFVPFLYGEADVAIRLQDNQHLAGSSTHYAGGDDDRLYPEPLQKAS
jgi:peroxiredoxin